MCAVQTRIHVLPSLLDKDSTENATIFSPHGMTKVEDTSAHLAIDYLLDGLPFHCSIVN